MTPLELHGATLKDPSVFLSVLHGCLHDCSWLSRLQSPTVLSIGHAMHALCAPYARWFPFQIRSGIFRQKSCVAAFQRIRVHLRIDSNKYADFQSTADPGVTDGEANFWERRFDFQLQSPIQYNTIIQCNYIRWMALQRSAPMTLYIAELQWHRAIGMNDGLAQGP